MRACHQVFLFPITDKDLLYTVLYIYIYMFTYVPLDNIPKILIAVYFTKCMYQLHSCGECIRIPDFHHLIWTLCGCLYVCLLLSHFSYVRLCATP